MKNKIYIIILAVLSALFISLGIYGYTLSNKKVEVKEKKEDYKITYTYYLENEKVETIPENKENKLYIFSKSNCTNNIVGNFDIENWKFVTTSKVSGNCELYFVKANYEVTLAVTNGIEDENNSKTVEREKDGKFKIIPNEGYKYKEAICSDNKVGTWEETTKTFTLNSITNDITCTVKFEKKDLNVEIVVENGKGNTTEKVYYGESKSILIEPASGYSNPNISCTNEQTAKYENNSINFEKITNDTKCTITFNKLEVKTYNFEITNPQEFQEITITGGDTKINNISEGKEITITLQSSLETTKPNLTCKDSTNSSVIPTIENQNETKTIRTFKFININSNINCTISKE